MQKLANILYTILRGRLHTISPMQISIWRLAAGRYTSRVSCTALKACCCGAPIDCPLPTGALMYSSRYATSVSGQATSESHWCCASDYPYICSLAVPDLSAYQNYSPCVSSSGLGELTWHLNTLLVLFVLGQLRPRPGLEQISACYTSGQAGTSPRHHCLKRLMTHADGVCGREDRDLSAGERSCTRGCTAQR